MDDCCGIFLIATCGCCCLSCSQTDNLWCLFKTPGGSTNYRVRSRSGMCCSCKRAMSDDDFERTVEQLYAPGNGPKPYDAQGNGNGNGRNSTHVLELQPTRTRKSGEGGGEREGVVVTTQPGPRPSMEARKAPERGGGGGEGPEDGDRERAILDSRKDAKARTRDWIAQQSKSLDGQHPHQRGPSDSAVPPPSREGSASGHRAHKSESHTQLQPQVQVQRPPEAHTQGGSHRARPSEPFLLPDLNVRGDGSLGRMSAGSRGELGEGGGAVRSRPNIPAALMPGRPQTSAPSQLPFDLGPVQTLGVGSGPSQVGGSPGSSPPTKGLGSAEGA